MPIPLILRLDITGQPVKWIDWQEAACLYARERVAWTAGTHTFALRGGIRRADGERSCLEINSIIAVRGEFRRQLSLVPPLNNTELFLRDQLLCLYCGKTHRTKELTRDHVIPLSRGGIDCWSNVVTACRRCNARKGNRTPEEAGMPLLAVPYIPNLAEYLLLKNHRILGDQMAFLKMQFGDSPRHRRT